MNEESVGRGVLRAMSTDDLELVRQWRNHPTVRRFMYTRHEIPTDEHRRWFSRCQEQPGQHLLIFERGGLPLGVINFSPTRFDGVLNWGFYASPDAPRGTGRALGQAAMEHAFQKLGQHKVCGEAIASNERSIRLHESLGFIQEGLLREHYFDGTRHHSVLCFGLLGHDWMPAR